MYDKCGYKPIEVDNMTHKTSYLVLMWEIYTNSLRPPQRHTKVRDLSIWHRPLDPWDLSARHLIPGPWPWPLGAGHLSLAT